MNKTLAIAKNLVVQHKTAIAVVVTAAVCIGINRIALKQHDNFLTEKGLFDEYYNSEA